MAMQLYSGRACLHSRVSTRQSTVSLKKLVSNARHCEAVPKEFHSPTFEASGWKRQGVQLRIRSPGTKLESTHRVQRSCRIQCSSSEDQVATPASTSNSTQPPPTIDLKGALKEVNADLERAVEEDATTPEKEAAALRVMDRLVEEGAVSGFGRWRGIPKREYTLSDMRLLRIDAEKLLSPKDTQIDSIRNVANAAAIAAASAGVFALGLNFTDVLKLGVAAFAAKSVDQVVNGGGAEALALDSLARFVSLEYRQRVSQHEAGHFLTAYLLGLLPKGYTLSSWDALKKYSSLNVQAGCLFCDSNFQKEVATGKVTSGSVDKFACVALAGVVVEFITFGQAEGGMADIQQLDSFMNALGFTQMKVQNQVRWAVLNTAALLREHSATHKALAEAMAEGKSVGDCIYVIESNLPVSQLQPLE